MVGELKEGEEVLRYSVLTVISSKGREEENNWADTGVLTVQSHNQRLIWRGLGGTVENLSQSCQSVWLGSDCTNFGLLAGVIESRHLSHLLYVELTAY